VHHLTLKKLQLWKDTAPLLTELDYKLTMDSIAQDELLVGMLDAAKGNGSGGKLNLFICKNRLVPFRSSLTVARSGSKVR
jgi:hypothetical protein